MLATSPQEKHDYLTKVRFPSLISYDLSFDLDQQPTPHPLSPRCSLDPVSVFLAMSGQNNRSRKKKAVELFPLGDALEKYLDGLDHVMKLDSQQENKRLTHAATMLETALDSLAKAQTDLIADQGEYIRLDDFANLKDFIETMEDFEHACSPKPFYRKNRRSSPPTWLNVRARDWSSCLEARKTEIVLDGDLDSILSKLCDRGIPPLYEYERPYLEAQLWDDFKRPFLGSGATDLQAHIKKQSCLARIDPKGYPAVCPVLQSSGTGKTRTVLQLGEIEPGLLVCVRDVGDPRRLSSCPRRDEAACRWLKTEKDLRILSHKKITVWLIALAEELTTFYRHELEGVSGSKSWSQLKVSLAKGLAPSGPPPRPPHDNAPEETLLSWRMNKIQRKERREMFDRIAERAAELLEEAPFSGPFSEDLSNQDIVSRLAPRLREAFHSFQEVLDPYWDDEAFFHLAIDSCGALEDDVYTLRRIWTALEMPRFWLLLVDMKTWILETGARDTSCKFCRSIVTAKPLTRGVIVHSDRDRIDISRKPGSPRTTPFYVMPHDVGLTGNDTYQRVLRGEAVLSHSQLVALLPLMGRPLLGDSLLQGGAIDYGGVSLYSILQVGLSSAGRASLKIYR